MESNDFDYLNLFSFSGLMDMSRSRFFTYCFLLFTSFSSFSSDDSILQYREKLERPKIAVVLAGGGAKGAAHIGVLRFLEQNQIPVDIITGTSMGSYVGGLYAMGYTANEIESYLYSINWSNGFRDRVDRSEREVRNKEFEDRYQFETNLGIRDGKLRYSRGFVQGQTMLEILRESVGSLPSMENFDELAIPFRAVATDIVAVEPVVMGEGYIIDAMMASMSVPGALPPYEVNGKLLVDGGMTNNMPVDIAKQMGADIVIAIDIGSDYNSAEDFTNVFSVAGQISNFLVLDTTKEQVKLLNEEDILLKPRVDGINTTNFAAMPEAYERGYIAAQQNKDLLMKLKVSGSEYQRYIDYKRAKRNNLMFARNVEVDKVTINNESHYTDEYIKAHLQLEEGQQYNQREAEEAIRRLYALDRFELVKYRYDVTEHGDEITVDVKEKTWGPNYLNFRFFLEDDFTSGSQYSLGASVNFSDLNDYGMELTTNFEVGTDKLIEAQLFSPFEFNHQFFNSYSLSYMSQNQGIPLTFDGEDGNNATLSTTENFLTATYRESIAQTTFGFQPTLWSEIGVGARYTHGEVELASLPRYGIQTYERKGTFFHARIDTLDSFSLPTKGIYLDVELQVSQDSIDGDDAEDTIEESSIKWVGAYSLGKHTLVSNFDVGLIDSTNELALLSPKQLGGFLNLSGIPRNSLIGRNKIYGGLIYRYKWFENDFGLFSSPVYLGAAVERGGVWSDENTNASEANKYNAGALFAGIDSPVGPMMLGYGRTENGYQSVYLLIGTSFK
ncbi:patatin-like phospholipase family protein [Vibrio sp.]|nr:patatin-like phospholipase family protein [Vibrio sp.]